MPTKSKKKHSCGCKKCKTAAAKKKRRKSKKRKLALSRGRTDADGCHVGHCHEKGEHSKTTSRAKAAASRGRGAKGGKKGGGQGEISLDALNPNSSALKKLLAKHNVNMKVTGKSRGISIVSLTGDSDDIAKVLAAESGWDDPDLKSQINSSTKQSKSASRDAVNRNVTKSGVSGAIKAVERSRGHKKAIAEARRLMKTESQPRFRDSWSAGMTKHLAKKSDYYVAINAAEIAESWGDVSKLNTVRTLIKRRKMHPAVEQEALDRVNDFRDADLDFEDME